MKSLYIFKSTPYNITNLPQFCFMLSRSDLFDPCEPTIVNGNLDMNIAKWARDISPNNPKLTFRNTNWSQHTNILDDVVNSDNTLAFGVNDSEQIKFLKVRYGYRVMSISCSYDLDFYDVMLTWYAQRHIRLQDAGMIPLTQLDHDIRNHNVNLVSYYEKSFREQQLIPDSMPEDGDYNIPIKDFFDAGVFFQHLTNIGAPPTAQSKKYYSEWYSYNNIL